MPLPRLRSEFSKLKTIYDLGLWANLNQREILLRFQTKPNGKNLLLCLWQPNYTKSREYWLLTRKGEEGQSALDSARTDQYQRPLLLCKERENALFQHAEGSITDKKLFEVFFDVEDGATLVTNADGKIYNSAAGMWAYKVPYDPDALTTVYDFPASDEDIEGNPSNQPVAGANDFFCYDALEQFIEHLNDEFSKILNSTFNFTCNSTAPSVFNSGHRKDENHKVVSHHIAHKWLKPSPKEHVGTVATRCVTIGSSDVITLDGTWKLINFNFRAHAPSNMFGEVPEKIKTGRPSLDPTEPERNKRAVSFFNDPNTGEDTRVIHIPSFGHTHNTMSLRFSAGFQNVAYVFVRWRIIQYVNGDESTSHVMQEGVMKIVPNAYHEQAPTIEINNLAHGYFAIEMKALVGADINALEAVEGAEAGAVLKLSQLTMDIELGRDERMAYVMPAGMDDSRVIMAILHAREYYLDKKDPSKLGLSTLALDHLTEMEESINDYIHLMRAHGAKDDADFAATPLADSESDLKNLFFGAGKYNTACLYTPTLPQAVPQKFRSWKAGGVESVDRDFGAGGEIPYEEGDLVDYEVPFEIYPKEFKVKP